MSLEAKDSGGGDFEPLSENIHHAVCSRIYDLGTQANEKFGGEDHKILITWEVPGETIEIDGEDLPKIISREYTMSLHKKANLRHDLEAWRGTKFTETQLKGFNLEKLLGANCQLQIVHVEKGDKTYANIGAIMALPKGSKKLKMALNYEPVSYKVEDGDSFPENTPKWIKEKIMNSKELKTAELKGMGTDSNDPSKSGSDDIADEDIPF